MNRRLLGAGVAAVCVLSIEVPGASAQRKPTACQDVPVTIRLDATRPDPDGQDGAVLQNAIRNDDFGWYIDGVDGVSAVLNVCSGTNNLTVDTGNRGRAFTYGFPRAVDGSSAANPPQYGTLGETTTSLVTFVFFRNVLNNRPGCDMPGRSSYSFTTDAFFAQVGKTADYRLRFVGPNEADPVRNNLFPDDLEVYEPSNVTVTFHPGNCDTTPDSWTITGYNPSADGYLQLATLHRLVKGKWVHFGQYEMPFQLHVVARVNAF